jgi:hypothetical protein
MAEVFLSAAARSIVGRRNFSDNLPKPNFGAKLSGIVNAEILTKVFGQIRDECFRAVSVASWRELARPLRIT